MNDKKKQSYIKEKELKVLEYPNGIVLPRVENTNAPRWGLGGVCDKDNQFVEASFYDGGWAKQGGYYNWDEEEYYDFDVVYIGLFFSHWGHFLVDLTGRMWFLQKLSQSQKNVKVAYIGEEIPKGNNLKFFELLGVREEQLINISKPTRFRKIWVPEVAFKSCEWYTKEFLEMFDKMYSEIEKREIDFVDLKDIDKIYFTRKKFSKAIATEFGEEYFETHFAKNGYKILAPETLSLEEQIYVWNNAKEIVCINGTIPLNVIFSKNKELKLIILNKTSILHENPIILLEMRSISATFIDIFKEPFANYPKSLGEGPFLLWPSKQFDKFCETNQFCSVISTAKRLKYFRGQQIKYCWAILGIKRRLRLLLSALIPQKMKNMRAALLHIR